VRKLLLVLLLPLVLATIAGAFLLYPFGHEQRTGAAIGLHQTPVKADVVAVAEGPCAAGAQVQVPAPTPQTPSQGGGDCLLVTVRMTDGQAAGQTMQVPVPNEPSTPKFAVGDAVVLAYSGTEPNNSQSYQIVDFQRGVPLAVLAVLFAIAVLVLGRWQGLAALGALLLSFVVLILFVLPAILAGENPLTVAVVGAGLIMFIVLYLTHGLSARTSTAVLGTLVSLALIGALGVLFSYVSKLTGLDEDTANLVTLLGHGIDTRGLLLAGALIGALGVLDDVTVTQTSAVWELRRANSELTWRQLYAAGLRIGRDHMSSVVNTLVMAYAGAALPVLLAFSVSGRTLGEILTAQQVAQEIVRTLVGSIGLVAAIPVTTALAAFVASKEKLPEHSEPEPEPDPEPEPEPDPPVVSADSRSAPSRWTGDIYTGYSPEKGPWRRPGERVTRAPTRHRQGPLDERDPAAHHQAGREGTRPPRHR
jgi:uncharacterized membrane protein